MKCKIIPMYPQKEICWFLFFLDVYPNFKFPKVQPGHVAVDEVIRRVFLFVVMILFYIIIVITTWLELVNFTTWIEM